MEILSLEEISEAVGSVTPVTGKVDRICTDTRKITENTKAVKEGRMKPGDK